MNKKEMLQSLINHYTGGKKSEFAKMIGVKPQTISTWLSRNTFDNELLFQKFPDISTYWLLTGEGEMFAYKGEKATVSNTQKYAIADQSELIAAKNEIIEALRQTISDKERLIRILLAASDNQK